MSVQPKDCDRGFAGGLQAAGRRLAYTCAKHVSDGVVKDGDKTRYQEFEIYVFLSVEQHTNQNKYGIPGV